MMVNKAPFPLRALGEVGYFRNIEVDSASADSRLEEENLQSVFAAMDQLMRTPTVIAGAVMPDACPTGEVSIPVGGVVVAMNAIHPGFHGADVCCSVMATNLGPRYNPKSVLDVAHKVTHFGKGGRTRSAGVFKRLRADLAERIRSNPFFSESDIKKAQLYLGTQGDGNHFLFVGRSEGHGGVVLVTHHGSRAFGASIYEKGLEIANRYCRLLSPNTPPENAWIPAHTLDGQRYWDALQIVREWTKLNHQIIHQIIAEKLGATAGDNCPGTTFWNEHNFVFRNPANDAPGRALYYHAKGATPLERGFSPDSPDGLRLIPLNMAQPVLVVKGEATPSNLGFAPHGAGRNLTRTRYRQFRTTAGKSDEDILAEETQGIDVRFFCHSIDISELPSAYKNADQVQRQIEKFGLGTIVDRIQPWGCIMAGTTHSSAPQRNAFQDHREVIHQKRTRRPAEDPDTHPS